MEKIMSIGRAALRIVVSLVLLVGISGALVGCGSFGVSSSDSADTPSESALAPSFDEALEKHLTDTSLESYEPSDAITSLDATGNTDAEASSDGGATEASGTTDSTGTTDASGTTDAPDSAETAAPEEESEASESVQSATVEKIVDGDTLWVNIDNETYKLRLIGVDTPESVHADASRNIPEGDVASDFTKSLVEVGQTVYLQKDKSDVDRYGRLLRYVWLDDPGEQLEDPAYVRDYMLNGILVYEGYAQAKQYRPDVAYASIFDDLQADAVANDRGVSYLWG